MKGRDVPLPKNWSNFLSLADNKADLAHFVSEELCSQAPVDKEIVVAGGFRDELEVKSSTGATDLGPLKSTHEEYDKILVLHAVHSQFHTVVVSSRDTDCSPTSRITRSKNAMSAYLDEVRHIKETAVHTH